VIAPGYRADVNLIDLEGLRLRVPEVRADLPAGETVAVLTANYGEAGAIERYGPARGLPPPYSGHNGFRSWRVPTGSAGPVLVVGYSDAERRDRLFRSCQRRATIDNGLGLDTEEQGVPVWMCSGPARAWYDLWPEIRHLD
jgi:hypothetical protein